MTVRASRHASRRSRWCCSWPLLRRVRVLRGCRRGARLEGSEWRWASPPHSSGLDDEVGLLRRAVLEYCSALEHKAARFPCNVPDDPLEADERGRAVAAVHHQVFDIPLAGDIAGERLCDDGPSQLWQVLALTIRLLVPAVDGESGVRNVLHVSTSSLK